MTTKTTFSYVEIPIYRTCFFIVVGLSDEELKVRLREYISKPKEIQALVEDSRVDDGYQAMTAFLDGYSIIRFNSHEDVKDINMISHEAFHVVCSIMRHIDMPLSEDSEEAFAYLLGFIVEQFERICIRYV